MVITDEQEVEVAVQFNTLAGNPAKVDGDPVWESSNPGTVELVPVDPPDAFKRIARRVGPLGSSQISAKADADLGAGMREVAAVLDIDVIASEAVSASIAAGKPRTAPPPNPIP